MALLENVNGVLSHCRHGQVVSIGASLHRIDGLVHDRDSIFCTHCDYNFFLFLSGYNCCEMILFRYCLRCFLIVVCCNESKEGFAKGSIQSRWIVFQNAGNDGCEKNSRELVVFLSRRGQIMYAQTIFRGICVIFFSLKN